MLGSIEQMQQQRQEALDKLDAKVDSGNYNATLVIMGYLLIAGMSPQIMKVMGVGQFTEITTQIGTDIYNVIDGFQYLMTAAQTKDELKDPDFWNDPTTQSELKSMSQALANLYYGNPTANISNKDLGIDIGGTTYYIYANTPSLSGATANGYVEVVLSTVPPSKECASDLDLLLSVALQEAVMKAPAGSISSPPTSDELKNLQSQVTSGPIVQTLLGLAQSLNTLGVDEGGGSVFWDFVKIGYYSYEGGNYSSIEHIVEQMIPQLNDIGNDYRHSIDPDKSEYGQTTPFSAIVDAGQNVQKAISSMSQQEVQLAKMAAQMISMVNNIGQAMNKASQQLNATIVNGLRPS